MKDITNELKERLQDVERQRNLLQKNLERLTATEDSLRTLLAIEEERWAEQQPLFAGTQSPKPERGRTPLSRFFLTTLKEKPKSAVVLSKEARDAGLLKDSKYPVRATHFALVGMKQGGLVEKRNGVWRLKNGDTPSVAGRLGDL